MTITLYTKPGCVQCSAAARKMKSEGLAFEPVDLTLPENVEHFERLRQGGSLQMPVLAFPEVREGDKVVFEAQTVNGYRVDVIDAFAQAARAA